MKPESYYVVVAVVSTTALAISLFNLLLSLLDRRVRLKIRPCRVRPQGVGGEYAIVPLRARHWGRHGVDLLYAFLIENGSRHGICIASCWEAVKQSDGNERLFEVRGRFVPSTFPHSVEAGHAVLVVMNRAWGLEEGDEMYFVVQQVGGKVISHKVCAEMKRPALDT